MSFLLNSVSQEELGGGAFPTTDNDDAAVIVTAAAASKEGGKVQGDVGGGDACCAEERQGPTTMSTTSCAARLSPPAAAATSHGRRDCPKAPGKKEGEGSDTNVGASSAEWGNVVASSESNDTSGSCSEGGTSVSSSRVVVSVAEATEEEGNAAEVANVATDGEEESRNALLPPAAAADDGWNYSPAAKKGDANNNPIVVADSGWRGKRRRSLDLEGDDDSDDEEEEHIHNRNRSVRDERKRAVHSEEEVVAATATAMESEETAVNGGENGSLENDDGVDEDDRERNAEDHDCTAGAATPVPIRTDTEDGVDIDTASGDGGPKKDEGPETILRNAAAAASSNANENEKNCRPLLESSRTVTEEMADTTEGTIGRIGIVAPVTDCGAGGRVAFSVAVGDKGGDAVLSTAKESSEQPSPPPAGGQSTKMGVFEEGGEVTSMLSSVASPRDQDDLISPQESFPTAHSHMGRGIEVDKVRLQQVIFRSAPPSMPPSRLNHGVKNNHPNYSHMGRGKDVDKASSQQVIVQTEAPSLPPSRLNHNAKKSGPKSNIVPVPSPLLIPPMEPPAPYSDQMMRDNSFESVTCSSGHEFEQEISALAGIGEAPKSNTPAETQALNLSTAQTQPGAVSVPGIRANDYQEDDLIQYDSSKSVSVSGATDEDHSMMPILATPVEHVPTVEAFAVMVGRILKEKLSEDEIEESLFLIVNLFLDAIDLVPKGDKFRIETAKYFLRAGKKAQASSAFRQAGFYHNKGIELLPDNHWVTHYKLSLDLFSSAAEAEYCVSDIDKMEAHCNEVLAQNNTPLQDKFRCYLNLVEGPARRNDLTSAIEMTLSILETLDCKFPPKALHAPAAMKRLLSWKGKLHRQITPEQICTLNRMIDAKRIFCMHLLEKMDPFCYITGNLNLFIMVVLKRIAWTIKYGYCLHSASAFSSIGIVYTGALGDIRLGEQCAKLCLSLQKMVGSRAIESGNFLRCYGLNLHQTTPLLTCMKGLLNGYQVGLEMGDLTSAMFGIYQYLELCRASGKSLEVLNADYSTYVKQMKETHQLQALEWALVEHQGVLNLIGQSENTVILTGDVMDQEEVLATVEKTKNLTLHYLVRRKQMYLACFLGEHRFGADLALEYGNAALQSLLGSNGAISQCFLSSLSCISAYKETKCRKYKMYAKAMTGRIRDWIKKGNPNIGHWGLLLDAEWMTLKKGKKFQAYKSYEEANKIAARCGFIHDRALINERYGEFLLELGDDTEEAKYRLQEAVKLYTEWGADRKVEFLSGSYDVASRVVPLRQMHSEQALLRMRFMNP